MEPVRILVVEDEALVALDLKRRLTGFGYEVIGTVASGGEAIAMVERSPPDLVLMDIQIQGPLDGVATAQAITERWDIPIVFLTAHSDQATVNRAQAVQPFGYLFKPFRDREIQVTLELALYKHQSESEKRRLSGQLQEVLVRIRKLSACLPVCARCRKIREDDHYWRDLHAMNRGDSEPESAANLCQDCLASLQGAL